MWPNPAKAEYVTALLSLSALAGAGAWLLEWQTRSYEGAASLVDSAGSKSAAVAVGIVDLLEAIFAGPAATVVCFISPMEVLALSYVHPRLTSKLNPSYLLQGLMHLGIQWHVQTRSLSFLLEAGVCPTRSEMVEAVFAEALEQHTPSLRAVLRGPGPSGWPHVLTATQRGMHEAVAALLELRADPNCREPVSGWMPLMYAVTAGDKSTAQTLLKHGASVNAVAKPHDWNALYCALVSNREDMIGLLLDAGANCQGIRSRYGHLSSSVLDSLERHIEKRKLRFLPQQQATLTKAAKPCMRPHDYFQYC